jgi:hypothetical protein
MRGLIYRLLDWITDRLVDVMIRIDPHEGAAGNRRLITPYRCCLTISLPLCVSLGTKMAARMKSIK